jgi:2-dehydropantoate 2-reductase
MNGYDGRMTMRIAVVGIGGIGGFYGGLLARHYAESKDVDVIFIARGSHLERIKANGLRMETPAETFVAKPRAATDDPRNLGTFDLVLFCMKTYDLENAAKLLAPNISAESTIIPVLNGVDNADRLRAMLNKGDIMNGCVYISSHIVEPGVVHQVGGSGKTFFGMEGGKSAKGKMIEGILRAARIDAEYREDIESLVWEKYVFICPFAGATTFSGRTIRGVLEDKEARTTLDGLLEEVLSIAKARKISLPTDIKKITLDKANPFPYETKTSMQLDFEKGKKAELETFTGYIVREGQRLGVGVPFHERVYEALSKRL